MTSHLPCLASFLSSLSRRFARSVALVCVAIPTLFALDPRHAIAQYHKRAWQVEDGLPRNYVTAILPSPEGYLLVGTDEGLARFDGQRFSPFDLAPGLNLSQRWVMKLLAARDASLWAGTFDGELVQVREGKTLYRYRTGASIFDLAEDPQGNIWASTRNGVYRCSPATPTHTCAQIPGLSRPSDTAWNVLSVDATGDVWVITVDGLFRVSPQSVSRVMQNHAGFGELLSVLSDPAGALWLGTSQGLYRMTSPPRVETVERQPGLDGAVVSLLRDHDGLLWVGMWGKGVQCVRQGTVAGWTSHDGLPDDFVRTLSEDGEGNLWIGTRGGGLNRWKDSVMVTYGEREGLAGTFATTVASGPDGDLWLGTWRGGLYRLHQGKLQIQPPPVPTLYFTVRALALDRSGHPWIGNWEGFYEFDGARYHHYAEPGSPYHHVSALLFDRAGRLWVGTSDNGLFVFPEGRPGTADHKPPLQLAAGREITALLEDSSGRIWAGTTGGLGVIDHADAPQLRWNEASRQTAISSITEDQQHRIWVCTNTTHVLLIEGPRTHRLSARDGLPPVVLYRAIDDGGGSLWISSAKGILQIPSRSIDDWLAHRRSSIASTLYGQEDGMRTIECHRLSQPAGGRAADGTVWFPTTKGFVRIQPRRVGPVAAPRLALEEIQVDGQPVAPKSPVRIHSGAHNIALRFTAFQFASPDKVRFRYRMEGFDPGWITPEDGERVARYNRLPPGRYRFLVNARMASGNWGSQVEAMTVEQLPRFYETGWFRLLLVAALAGMVFGIYRWRIHALRGRYALVLAERNRISSEWHDTLLAGFSAISWQLEETLSRLKSGSATARDTVEMALKMVHHYRAEARRVIWDLRENRPDSESLTGAITESLQQATAGMDIEMTMQVSGEPRRLPEDLERNVLRICQEAASNAIRHGRAKHIRVALEYQSQRLLARIEDDGSGFERTQSLTGHFGLAVMEERARRFGGRFTLESEPGKGTIVETEIPIRPVAPR